MKNRFAFMLLLFNLMRGDSIISAQTAIPKEAGKLVIFEIFARTGCGNCKAAASVIRAMIKEYAGQPVLFLEQSADHSLGNRFQRWQKRYNRNDSAALPFTMVDSGQQISCGPMEFKSAFRGIVNDSMARAVPARLTAETRRVGNSFRVFLQLTNQEPNTLTYKEHQPALQIIIYEEAELIFAGYPVKAMVTTEIYQDLRSGVTIPFILETPDLQKLLTRQYKGKIPWERLRVAALADYLPQGQAKAYDLLASCSAPITSHGGEKNRP